MAEGSGVDRCKIQDRAHALFVDAER